MDEQNRWLSWAIELRSLAQAGLTYPLSAANSFRISKRPKQNISAETNCRRISPGEKTSREQILMCFDANESKHWETKLD